MRYQWIPWKPILRHLTTSRGFVDPVALMAQFNKFAQPSEVAVPGELLRAGMLFHARGLMNARVIQGNLDWLWPYWIRKQFDPTDDAFVPRSFAPTQVNLTHRNWTAVGLPDVTAYPIVDPRGLVTPFYDGWSLDGWVVGRESGGLFPSARADVRQVQRHGEDGIVVETTTETGEMRLRSRVDVVMAGGRPVCRIRYSASSTVDAVLAIALRPFNPEGISLIYAIAADGGLRWGVNDVAGIDFDRPMDRHLTSDYQHGDVKIGLLQRDDQPRQSCPIGMASAAALYRLPPRSPAEVTVTVALDADAKAKELPAVSHPSVSWKTALDGVARLTHTDDRIAELYDAALHTLVLLSPLEIYPGPFYYRRFWFRDAVFILNGFLRIGLHERARRAIQQFLPRQTRAGFFESQQGEWDSNGQVLWIFRRYAELTGAPVPADWLKAAERGANWILRKRLSAAGDSLHAGLLPAGFSAEHLGNNDYYYWDNFWGIAGLQAAAELFAAAGHAATADRFARGADHFALCLERSLLRSRQRRRYDALPASPYRRMDAGAIGSIIPGYPLQLWPPEEPRLMNTLEFLIDDCFVDGAFFQDMIHSGFNIYLTLHCAQSLLRAGDGRFWPMVAKVADLASPTGHWPEAIHPRTLGGCMGDGQHAWAAVEWIMMIHNMFVAEEGDDLYLLRGIPRPWLNTSGRLAFGPVHTRFGPVSVTVDKADASVTVEWSADWRRPPAAIYIQPCGISPVVRENPSPPHGRIEIPRTTIEAQGRY